MCRRVILKFKYTLILIKSKDIKQLTISSSFEHPFLAVHTKATMTPPPNISRRNTANFQPWSLCGISFLAAGNLATSAVETPTRDALTRIVLRRLDAFSQAIFVGLLFEADLDFTCTWSISLVFSHRVLAFSKQITRVNSLDPLAKEIF